MRHRTSLSLLFATAISIAAMYVAFRNVSLSSIGRYFLEIDTISLAVAAGFVMMSLFLRGLRWKLILSPYSRLTFPQAYHPLAISLMFNCILPGRIGELVRPVWHKTKGEASFSSGVASIAAERLLDLLTLLMLLSIMVLFVDLDDGISTYYKGTELTGELLLRLARNLLYFCVALLAGILILGTHSINHRLKKLILSLPDRLLVRSSRLHGFFFEKVCTPLARIVDLIKEGFSVLHSFFGASACIGLSFAIWLLWATGYFILVQGSPSVTLSFFEVTASMVIICLFVALPSVPGYWGLWEAGGIFSLSIFGVHADQAAGITLANHAIQLLPVFLAGLVSIWLSNFKLSGLRRTIQT